MLDKPAYPLASLLFAFFALPMMQCQKGPPPRAIALEVPEQIVGSDAARVIVTLTTQDGNRKASTEQHDFVVEPEGLAKVSKQGFVTCQKSGDGTLSLSIGDVTGSTPLACRMVAKIEAKDVGRVDIADGAFEPEVKIVDKAGKELPDVKLTYSPKITSAVKAKGLQLVPAGVGQTEVVASAGPVSTTFKVEVVKQLKPEALPMSDNRRIDFSLAPGNYELVVKLKEPKPIRVTWRTAPYCHYDQKPKKVHVATCTLREKGGVVFDNPAYLNDGSSEVGHKYVEIREIP